MLTTLSPHPPLARLHAIATKTGVNSILDSLRAVSLTGESPKFLGMLVWFLASRERAGILSGWAPDSAIASDLERLGRAVWAEDELLRELRPVGDEHLVSQLLRGHLRSHYLAAMAAARRPFFQDEDCVLFVERLRLLLLIRSIEASYHGILRECHLRDVCVGVRQICDRKDEAKWRWFIRLTHSLDGLPDFVSETRHQCVQVLAKKQFSDAAEGAFVSALRAVLDGERRLLGSPLEPAGSQGGVSVVAVERPARPEPSANPLAVDQEGDQVSLAAESDDVLTLAVAHIDPSRPPPSQRAHGVGLVLQTLEETQYLRHSWHRLSKAEQGAFMRRLSDLLRDENVVDRVGAALIGVATLTSMPVSSVGRLRLAADLHDDWALDIRRGSLRRRPPRFARRWRADMRTATGWVSRQLDEWRIDLSPPMIRALRDGILRPLRPVTLEDLWESVNPEAKLEAWFADRFAADEPLERLTSPVVPSVLAQQAFEASDDHVLARLVGSSTRTGLPSACAYGAFTGAEVHTALSGAVAQDLGSLVAPGGSDKDNAAGSELDVDIGRLKRAIDVLTRAVDRTAENSALWVEHHNRLTALCVVALLASTGARPVTSPFESPSWIDLERRLIYVEDKHSGPTRGARLCVLSGFAHELIADCYRPHLSALAETLASYAPAFVVEIRKILSRDAECRLPMFFFLRAEPALDWIEVSESQLDIVCNSPWPLPWNLFRHLHATQFRRWNLHPEIRDALLGHGDHGAESHGAFSWRVPRDDIEEARTLVNRLADELGFRLPSGSPTGTVLANVKLADPGFTASRPFGRRARAARREKTHESARRTASSDIERALNGRLPSTLSPDDWDQIARRMLLREDNMPHSMASLRYDVFEDFLTKLWRDDGTTMPRLPSRRYIPVREGSSPFTEDFIDAEARLSCLRRDFDEIASAGSRRTTRPVLAGCLAALELALHCRVDNFAALCAVTCNSASVRVVRFSQRFWLEWSYGGEWHDGRPVYRAPITDRAAAWIGLAQSGKKRLEKLPPVPESLLGFGAKHDDFGGLLRFIADLITQENAFHLPGAVAAVVGGRLNSSALPHADWLRTTYLQAPTAAGETIPEPATHLDSHETAGDETYFRDHHRAVSQGSSNALQRCRQLFQDVQQILSQPRMPRMQGDADAGAVVRPSLNRRASEVVRAVKRSGFGSGDAPYVLAHYAVHLLTRPKRSNAGDTLKSSTALRYWYALAPGFLDFAFDANLAALEDEDITELYARIVKAAVVSPGADAAEETSTESGHARRRSLKIDSDAGHRALAELESFHEFARTIYGLEDPDWAEISPRKPVGGGRPGIVLLAEYDAALRALLPDADVRAIGDDTLCSAFVLLICARFGLRTGEAVGLQRNDWVDIAGSIVVLVRSNTVRGLKTTQSKRQVPLIGQLNLLERALVEEILRRWEHREGTKRATPLLPGVDSSSFKHQKGRISSQLLVLLKAVTCNSSTTVHHLRHGFASRLLVMLSGRSVGSGLSCTLDETSAARGLLLSANLAGRRTLWAVARTLGHASPAMTLKAYTHIIDGWLPAPPSRPADIVDHRFIIDLDATPRAGDYLARTFSPPITLQPKESLFLRYLQYLRLRTHGHRNAAWSSQLSSTQASRLDQRLEHAALRLTGTPEARRTAAHLLSGISETRWKALIALARDSKDPSPVDATDWVGTIGANRQILLFLEEHFKWASRFIRSLDLMERACRIVLAADVDPGLLQYMGDEGLASYAKLKQDWSSSFQIDVARMQAPQRVFEHRVALMPVASGPIATTIEQVVLWVAWLTANSDT